MAMFRNLSRSLFRMIGPRGQRGVGPLAMIGILGLTMGGGSVMAVTLFNKTQESTKASRKAIETSLEQFANVLALPNKLLLWDDDGDSAIDRVEFSIMNPLGKPPGLDFTATPDSNNNGLLSDEANPRHSTVVSVAGKTSLIKDVAWTAAPQSSVDGDTFLGPREEFLVTISLASIPKQERPRTFDFLLIEIKPKDGQPIAITKPLPALHPGLNIVN